jgi:PiT family inorganic phosphate transporter
VELWGQAITLGAGLFLFLALALALSFEFVNGFHDTANAVATVIYTHTLKPVPAVVWSGLWNLIGVLTSSGLVAYGIIALLPQDLVMNVGAGGKTGEYIGFAMIFALLLSAIVWNIGTWYLGLPVSSTHTLIGSILGVGVAHAVISGLPWTQGLNLEQINKVILALLLSPLVGFIGSALLLLATKLLIHRQDLFQAPKEGETPPGWIRGTLIGTCTGVSFSHGYNDGQKGMGLMMLILIGVLPGAFALQNADDSSQYQKTSALAGQAAAIFQRHSAPANPAATAPNPAPATPMAAPLQPPVASSAQKALDDFIKTGHPGAETFPALSQECATVQGAFANLHGFDHLSTTARESLRKDVYLLGQTLAKLSKTKIITDAGEKKTIGDLQTSLKVYTEHIPVWIKVAVALALGLGTMIGWKRVVVTVGEKIGKAHLTYAQGGSAELVAFITILGAGLQGWPVSTTHVLSSGIAGTMAANRSGLQKQTLINIVLAWVLTLPVCVFLGAIFFSGGLYFVFHIIGVH